MYRLLLLAVLMIVILGSYGPALGQAEMAVCRLNPNGTYDAGFGKRGVAGVTFGAPEGSKQYVAALAIGPENTIVIAGTADIDGEVKIGLARLTPSGFPDESFNSTGRRRFNLPGDIRETVSDLAVDGKGKITVVGSGGYTKRMFAVTRFEDDGSLSETFGGPRGDTEGYVYLSFGSNEERSVARAVALDDVSIIVVGSTESESGNRRFALAKLHPSGSPDNSFNMVGTLINDLVGFRDERLEDVYVDSEHRIVAAGHGDPGDGGSRFMIMRYLPDGSPDGSFKGPEGLKPGDFEGTDMDIAVALAEGLIENDGSRDILAAGYAGRDATYNASGGVGTPEEYSFAMLRSNPDGKNDRNFGDLGYLSLRHTKPGKKPDGEKPSHDTSKALKIAVQPDGKIVLAGYVGDWRREGSGKRKSYKLRKKLAIVRLDEDGSPDSTFGTGGWVFIDYIHPERSDESAVGLGIQPDGKIVVAGALAPTVPIDVRIATMGAQHDTHVKGEIAVRIFKPPFWRFGNQATAVAVYVPGGHKAGDLEYDPDIEALTRDGVVALKYLMPGGSWEGEGGDTLRSEGSSYWRDENCMEALRDVVRYALGLGREPDGTTFAERIGSPYINSVGLFAFSAGANHAISTLARYGSYMKDGDKRPKWYVGSENPTRSEFGTCDLGSVDFDWDPADDENKNGIDDDEGTNGFQTDFDPKQVNFAWDYLAYDANQATCCGDHIIMGLPFFDGNRNGIFEYDDVDSDDVFEPFNDEDADDDGNLEKSLCDSGEIEKPLRGPGEWDGDYSPDDGEDYPLRGPFYKDGRTVKVFYSRPVRTALEEGNFDLTEHVATIEETEEWWEYREAIPRLPDVKEVLPNLKYIQTFSKRDHAQSCHLDSAQLHVQEFARALHKQDFWYRLNPDESYVYDVYERMTGEPPDWDDAPVDNNANVWVNDLEVRRFAEWHKYDRHFVFAAGVLELIDRCYVGDWSDNLHGVLVEPYR